MEKLQSIRSNGRFHVQISETVMKEIFDSLNCGDKIRIGYLTGSISGESSNVIDVKGIHVPTQNSSGNSSEVIESIETSFGEILTSGEQVVGIAVFRGNFPVFICHSDISNLAVFAKQHPGICLLINSKGESNLLN